MEHHFSINLIATEQAKIVPKLTEKGFEKRKIPKDVYSAILTNRKKLLVSGEKWNLEYCSNGIQNCMKVYESEQAQECHIVSSERYIFRQLSSPSNKPQVQVPKARPSPSQFPIIINKTQYFRLCRFDASNLTADRLLRDF